MPNPGANLGAHMALVATVVMMMTYYLLVHLEDPHPVRVVWRDQTWIREGRMWDQLLAFDADDTVNWKKYVGVSKSTFEFIVSEVRDELSMGRNYDTEGGRVACLEERVAVGLYQLHNGVTRNVLRHVAKWGESTCGGWTVDLARALCKVKCRWIFRPDEDELAEISAGFERFIDSPLTGCGGALDGKRGGGRRATDTVVGEKLRY